MGAMSAHAGEEAIPAAIRADLDARYPGWQLYDLDVMQPGERKYCSVSGGAPLVGGDFNGDGTPDYGVLIAYRHKGYALAYVSRSKGYRRYTLFPAKPNDTGSPGLLSLVPKGSTRPDIEANRPMVALKDGVTLIFCESSRVTYYFRRNKFAPVFEAD